MYDTNIHQFVGSIKRPRGGRFADCYDCQLYVHDGDAAEVVYVAWPDCIKVRHGCLVFLQTAGCFVFARGWPVTVLEPACMTLKHACIPTCQPCLNPLQQLNSLLIPCPHPPTLCCCRWQMC